jgi:S1-C subfamily serine protease
VIYDVRYSFIYITFANAFLFALSPEEIARQSFPSSVGIYLFDEDKNPIKSGSGFFVSPGVIATNYHVIEGASFGIAKIVGKEKKHQISNVKAVNQRIDLALIEVSDLSIPPLFLDNGRKLSVGQKVYAIGNPQGLEGTFSEGIVSSVREVGDDYYIQMTTPISSGSSGGPVLDDRGLVVGLSVATYQNGQNLNFAVPVKYVLELIGSPVVKSTADPFELSASKYVGPSLFNLPSREKSTHKGNKQLHGSDDGGTKSSLNKSGDTIIMSR